MRRWDGGIGDPMGVMWWHTMDVAVEAEGGGEGVGCTHWTLVLSSLFSFYFSLLLTDVLNVAGAGIRGVGDFFLGECRFAAAPLELLSFRKGDWGGWGGLGLFFLSFFFLLLFRLGTNFLLICSWMVWVPVQRSAVQCGA